MSQLTLWARAQAVRETERLDNLQYLAYLVNLCYTAGVNGAEDTPHDLMTVQEVATRLRVSPATVYAWLKAGVLPACRIGGTWRVHRRDLEILIRGSSAAT